MTRDRLVRLSYTFMNFLRIINLKKGKKMANERTNNSHRIYLASGTGTNSAWANTWMRGGRGRREGAIHFHRGAGESLHNRIGPDSFALSGFYEMRLRINPAISD